MRKMGRGQVSLEEAFVCCVAGSELNVLRKLKNITLTQIPTELWPRVCQLTNEAMRPSTHTACQQRGEVGQDTGHSGLCLAR